MSVQGEMSELYEKLQAAKDEKERAWAAWSSCNINTPGRCANEARALKQASDEVARIEALIRQTARRVEYRR